MWQSSASVLGSTTHSANTDQTLRTERHAGAGPSCMHGAGPSCMHGAAPQMRNAMPVQDHHACRRRNTRCETVMQNRQVGNKPSGHGCRLDRYPGKGRAAWGPRRMPAWHCQVGIQEIQPLQEQAPSGSTMVLFAPSCSAHSLVAPSCTSRAALFANSPHNVVSTTWTVIARMTLLPDPLHDSMGGLSAVSTLNTSVIRL